MPESTIITQLIRTRLLVAAIGERLEQPWWRTQFLTPTALNIGARLFPRSFRIGALSSVTVAACRDHDANTGRHSFHLFRLPAFVEHQMFDAAAKIEDWTLPEDTDSIVTQLHDVQPAKRVKFASGPKSLGSVAELKDSGVAGTLASLYAEAVRNNKRVYPYFEAADDE